MSFFIHEDVSFHVPDELVSQELRFGSCPQDVFPNITHLQTSKDQSSLQLSDLILLLLTAIFQTQKVLNGWKEDLCTLTHFAKKTVFLA